jgi:hypothetical protein
MKTLRLVSVAVLVLLIGASCGQPSGSSSTGDPTELIAASADTTSAAGTAKMSMQMTTVMPQGEFVVDAEGAYDFANKRGAMTMQMDLGEAAGEMGPMDIEMVFEDMVIYMKYPMLSELSADAKPWIRMDLQEVGEQAGMDFGSLMQSGTSDPTQMLEWLRGASGDIEVVGEEDVRGVMATHYKGTIDFNRVVEQAPADVRDALRATVDMMVKTIGTSNVPFEVWIDEAGRAVRIAQSFEYEEGAVAGGSMSMTLDLFDFGTDVEVQIPPASQTSDFKDLMGSMGSSTSSGTATTSP